MELQFNSDDLRPLIQLVVRETLEEIETARAKCNGRVAYSEVEAAEMLGVAPHVLRDHRLRLERENGEKIGRKIGKAIRYNRDELLQLAGMLKDGAKERRPR